MTRSPALRPAPRALDVATSQDVPPSTPSRPALHATHLAAAQDVRARPLLRVVRGEPTAEELAALVAVVAVRTSVTAPPVAPAPSRWGRPVLRAPLHPGPGAWRASGLPR